MYGLIMRYIYIYIYIYIYNYNYICYISDCEIILAGNNDFTGIRTYCFWWNCSYYNLSSKRECLSRCHELCTVWDRYGNEGEIRYK